MIVALLVGVAAAHPFAQEFYGHAIDMTVGEDTVRIDYIADVPTRDLWSDLRERERKHDPTDRFVQQAAGTLVAGLSLTIDGAVPPTTPLASEVPVIDSRFVTFHVAFQVPLPPGPHRIAIGNGNAPEKIGYYLTRIDVARAWEVTATSLIDPKTGKDRVNEWGLDEIGRSSWVDVAPRSAWQAAILRIHPDPHGKRLADVAIATSSFDELGETPVPLVLMVVGLVGAAVLGWTVRR